jgi:hypothetical protein
MAFGRKKGDIASAKSAVNRFWGVSNGSMGDLRATAEHLKECSLGKKDINELRAELPVGATGTTGQRVSRIDRVLKRLEYGA